MQLWICDSKAKSRWGAWSSSPPPNWTVTFVEKPDKRPSNATPTLIVIHDRDAWTWQIRSELPGAQVVRYTAATQELITHPVSGDPFCSLDYLQNKLTGILSIWPATIQPGWLFEALGDTPLECALQLLHALLPPSIDPRFMIGDHEKAWHALTAHVSRLNGTSSFASIERSHDEARALYERCLEAHQSYSTILSSLRDALLSDEDPPGLINAIERSHVA